MKAEIIGLRCDTAVVVVRGDTDSSNAIITINSGAYDSLAKGIARMINDSQCPNCGKFNGLHGEIFVKTGQSGFGDVEGQYVMCQGVK